MTSVGWKYAPKLPVTQLGQLRYPVHVNPYDFCRDLRDDCVAVGAQASHAAGKPMSQRECAGFNWPPLSISAVEPISISPVAVSRAGPVIDATAVRVSATPRDQRIPLLSPSSLRGVGHAARSAASAGFKPGFIPRLNFASGGFPLPLFVQFGVGQPARFACLGSWSKRSDPSALGLMSVPVSFQSRVVVVTQPARAEAVCSEMPPLFGRSAIA